MTSVPETEWRLCRTDMVSSYRTVAWIATRTVADVPLSWVTQLAVGRCWSTCAVRSPGKLLCLLTQDATGDDEVVGLLLDIAGNLMWAPVAPALL